MAEIGALLTAVGAAAEVCAGCDRPFARGEQMSGVTYDDGDPAGWFCAACIARWREHGHLPTPGEKTHG